MSFCIYVGGFVVISLIWTVWVILLHSCSYIYSICSDVYGQLLDKDVEHFVSHWTAPKGLYNNFPSFLQLLLRGRVLLQGQIVFAVCQRDLGLRSVDAYETQVQDFIYYLMLCKPQCINRR